MKWINYHNKYNRDEQMLGMDKLILGMTQVNWRMKSEQIYWEQPTSCGLLDVMGISHYILQEMESTS